MQASKLTVVHQGTSGDFLEVMYSHPGYIGAESLGILVNSLEELRFIRPEEWAPKAEISDVVREVGMTYLLCRFPFYKPEAPAAEDASFILDDE